MTKGGTSLGSLLAQRFGPLQVRRIFQGQLYGLKKVHALSFLSKGGQ